MGRTGRKLDEGRHRSSLDAVKTIAMEEEMADETVVGTELVRNILELGHPDVLRQGLETALRSG